MEYDRNPSPPAETAVQSGRTLDQIPGLEALWALTRGDSRVAIAVLDGPVDLAHPAFAGASIEVAEAVAPARPTAGGRATLHGTAVASVIFGQHGGGSPVSGIAPRCRGIIVPPRCPASSRWGP